MVLVSKIIRAAGEASPPIPTVETERLFLRPPTIEDWPLYCELMASPRSKFMGGPFLPNTAWGMFCRDVAQWELMGHGALMMEDRLSGACLGQVGINSAPPFPGHELGWLVYPEAEGKGYAYEAALAMRDWAFNTFGLKTLVSYIDPKNSKSRKLAERLGAVEEKGVFRPNSTELVFRHPSP